MLRAESGRWEHRPRPRVKPRYPNERAEDRLIALSRNLVGDILSQAHALFHKERG